MPPRVLCVVGPTASGKTKMGVLLARHYGGEVVSVDSMQIYRGLTVGTAAPTPEEQMGIPHHMVGVASVEESWSVARFVREADGCIQDILRRGKLPVLVGGTGLYLDAILAGRDFAPGLQGGETRRQLEERLEREGIDPLREELAAVDPDSVRRIAPADAKRLLRALEVYYETGETITAHNARTAALPPKYEALTIGLAFRDREEMKALIDRRVDQMAQSGLLEEVDWLLRQDLPPSATALQAIGYKEFAAYRRGEAALEEALELVKLRSRQYAKRQLTWMRRRQDIHWYFWEGERDFPAALQDATKYLSARGLG